jgi:hypothetical protein
MRTEDQPAVPSDHDSYSPCLFLLSSLYLRLPHFRSHFPTASPTQLLPLRPGPDLPLAPLLDPAQIPPNRLALARRCTAEASELDGDVTIWGDEEVGDGLRPKMREKRVDEVCDDL